MIATPHPPEWKVEWKSGQGKRWSIGLRGPNAEEVVVRAESPGQAEGAARAVLLATASFAAIKRAHSALFTHGDCESCCNALEDIEAVLKDWQEPLVTATPIRQRRKRTTVG